MPIEVLFIIPVVAISLFVLIIILSVQKKKAAASVDKIAQTVERYNSGSPQGEESLGMDKTIDLVSKALSNQQKIIEGFQGKDSTVESELKEMKNRLLEMQNEYDIMMSENYTLKAKLRDAGVKFETKDTDAVPVVKKKPQTKSKAMLDDTRTFQRKNIEDLM